MKAVRVSVRHAGMPIELAGLYGYDLTGHETFNPDSIEIMGHDARDFYDKALTPKARSAIIVKAEAAARIAVYEGR